MSKISSKSWFRTGVLACASAIGITALGADDVWTGGGTTTDWADTANWNNEMAGGGNFVINTKGTDVNVTFADADSISTGLWIENIATTDGTDNTVTFTAGSAEAGLTTAGLNIGTSYGFGSLALAQGTFVSTEDIKISNGGTGSLTITNASLSCGTSETAKWLILGVDGAYDSTITIGEGGNLKVHRIQHYKANSGTDKVILDGGTLTALGAGEVIGDNWADNGASDLEITSNGGTVDTGAFNTTIESAVTGSGTIAKTGSGTLTFTAVPASTVLFNLREGTLVLPTGYEGSVTTDVEGAIVSSVNGTYTLIDGTAYIWSGASGDGLWATTNNWTVGGAVPETAPAVDSTVYIPAGDGTELTITCAGSSDYTGYLTIARPVVLYANGGGITLSTIEGESQLTIQSPSSTETFYIHAGNVFAISAPLCVKGRVYNNSQSHLAISGALTGDGLLVNYSNDGQAGFYFSGDASGFTGTYTGGNRASGTRDGTRFYSGFVGSPSATWNIGYDGSAHGGKPFMYSGTYVFGALNSLSGNNLSVGPSTGVTLEVGGLANATSTVGGTLVDSSNKIVKVGDSSTLDLTLTATVGTIEANAGTVNLLSGSLPPEALYFTSGSPTVTIAADVGTTVDEVFTAFVPSFSAECAGYQFATYTDEGSGDVTYTVVKTAKDSADNEYYSVADAFESVAAAVAENPDFDKTVTLIANTTEAVVIPAAGYVLDTAGFTYGSVTGASGVGVTEADGVFTGVENASSTWQGAAEGANWADASNWSTGVVPGPGTSVSFPSSALVYISDYVNLAHTCGTMNIGNTATVEFAPTDRNQEIYPRIAVAGDINGKGTIKLFRCGIYNNAGAALTIYPAIVFENDGTHDSWFENGDFTFGRSVTGTGLLVCYTACRFNTGIYLPSDGTIEFRAIPNFPGATQTLTGEGTVAFTVSPYSSTRFMNAIRNPDGWLGVCELKAISVNGIDAAGYGNTNSTVRFNGTTGYVRSSDGANVEVGKVKCIDIGENGLTLNNQFSSGAGRSYTFDCALTGSGAIVFGTKHLETAHAKYIFTGDCTGFTGAVNFGSLTEGQANVIFRSADAEDPTCDSCGKIYVLEGQTVAPNATWTAPAGIEIAGTVNLGSAGALDGTVTGSGTIAYAAMPSAAPSLDSTWAGTIELPATTISAKTGLPLPGLTTENGTLVLKGIGRSTDARSIYIGTGASATIAGTTQVDGDVYMTDGNSDATYTWNKVTGSGNLYFSTEGSAGTPNLTHAITTLEGYTGTISAKSPAMLTIGTVSYASADHTAGKPVVKLVSGANLTTDPAAIAVVVDGEATELTLAKAGDGNLYLSTEVPVAQIASGETVTSYTNFDDAVAAITEGCTLKILSMGLILSNTVEVAFTLDVSRYAVSSCTVDASAPVLQPNITVVSTASEPGALAFWGSFNGTSGQAFKLAKTGNIDLISVAEKDYELVADTTLAIDADGYAVYTYPVVESTFPSSWNGGVTPSDAIVAKYATWKASYPTATDASEAAFLLNIDPAAEDQTIDVTAISVSGTTVTITVDQKLNSVNGVVYAIYSDSLAGLATPSYQALEFTDADASSTATISVGKFYKIAVGYAVPSAE